MNFVPVIFILAALLYLQHLLALREQAAGSRGTLMQLVAKGPQDAYLTGYRPNGLSGSYTVSRQRNGVENHPIPGTARSTEW